MNYLEYLNENYFKEKGFTKIPSKINEIKKDKRIDYLDLIKKFLYLSKWT
tara:strand:+ start:802 stop:951 length:150 start_codon:yes stop_codon:yes gene_type:complete